MCPKRKSIFSNYSGEKVRVQSREASSPVEGTISGVDEGGWLLVRTEHGELRVAPDGNTFDMMAGLLAPKL